MTAYEVEKARPMITNLRVIDRPLEYAWELPVLTPLAEFEARKNLPFGHPDWVHPLSEFGGVQYDGVTTFPGRADGRAQMKFILAAIVLLFVAMPVMVVIGLTV